MKQYSLFDFMEYLLNDTVDTDTLEKSETNYLVKEERILSLARESFQKRISGLKLSKMEERLYSVKLTGNMSFFELISKVAQYVIRPFLVSFTGEDDLTSFNCLLHNCKVKLSLVEESDANIAYLRKFVGKKEFLSLTFYEDGFPPLLIYGYKNERHPKKVEDTLFKSGILMADLAKVLAGIVLIDQMNTFLKKCDDDWISDLPKEIFQLLGNELASKKQILAFSRYNTDIADMLPATSVKCLLPNTEEHALSYGAIPILKMLFPGLKDEYTSKSETELLKSLNKEYVPGNSIELLGGRKMDGILFNYHPVLMAKYAGGLSYHILLSHTERKTDGHEGTRYWGLISKYQYATFFAKGNLIMTVIRALWEEKGRVVETASYLRKLESDYAKSYQTKKHIPEKIVAAMKDSLFNRYFGFVEMDELCDVQKVQELAMEFASVKDAFFNTIDCSMNAIRFRRLGNHKASGLYYPNAKCLCVDINNPCSLIHELGHLIDYEMGGLSSNLEFKPIYRLYKKILLNKMECDSSLNALLKGKGKYNLSYYLLETEVFARSFELFNYQILDIRNSLLPVSFSEVYPMEEEFIKLIGEYFKVLFDIHTKSNLAA